MKHKINVNGVTYEVDEKEASKYECKEEEFPAPEPTTKEEIAKLKEELKAAKILLGLEV